LTSSFDPRQKKRKKEERVIKKTLKKRGGKLRIKHLYQNHYGEGAR